MGRRVFPLDAQAGRRLCGLKMANTAQMFAWAQGAHRTIMANDICK